jgi:hypothetical protein
MQWGPVDTVLKILLAGKEGISYSFELVSEL